MADDIAVKTEAPGDDARGQNIEITHYGYLDGLRGLAAILVLFVHLPQLIIFAFGDYFGSYGVHLFYILSALTLFLSSEKRFLIEKKPIRKFFIRRFFRIAPLFYLVVLVAWLSGFGVQYRLPAEGVTGGNVISHFFFVFGFNKYWINSLIGVEWSIFCEVCFYLTLPILFLYVKRKRTAVYLAIGAFLLYLAFKSIFFFFFASADRLLYEWSSLFILSNYFYFVLGVVLFFFIKDAGRAKKSFLFVGWAVFWAGAAAMYFSDLKHFDAPLMALLWVLLVFLMKNGLPISKVFDNPLTRLAGKISYSMYLWHYPALSFFAAFFIKNNLPTFEANPVLKPLAVVGAIAFVFAVSGASYLLVEKPGMALGKKIIKAI